MWCFWCAGERLGASPEAEDNISGWQPPALGRLATTAHDPITNRQRLNLHHSLSACSALSRGLPDNVARTLRTVARVRSGPTGIRAADARPSHTVTPEPSAACCFRAVYCCLCPYRMRTHVACSRAMHDCRSSRAACNVSCQPCYLSSSSTLLHLPRSAFSVLRNTRAQASMHASRIYICVARAHSRTCTHSRKHAHSRTHVSLPRPNARETYKIL